MPFPTRVSKKSVIRRKNEMRRSSQQNQHGTAPMSPIQQSDLESGELDTDKILYLQRTIGNHATQQWVSAHIHTRTSEKAPVQRGFFDFLKKKQVQAPPTKTPLQLGLENAPLVPDPTVLKDHRFYIKPGVNVWIKGDDGKWTNAGDVFGDGEHHEIPHARQDDKWYYGKFDDTEVAVAKANVTKSSYQAVGADVPLFPKGSPNINDVKQGGVGDCYLMAAMASLAKDRPDYLKTIMADNGETVSVRLFKVNMTNPSKHIFTPKYIKVEKSIAKDPTGSTLYNQGALWVSMLEKAYAAGGFTGGGETTDKPSFENISGGFARHAFEVLTGEQAMGATVAGGPMLENNKYVYENQTGWRGNTHWRTFTEVSLPWDDLVLKQYEDVKNSPQKLNYSPIGIYATIFDKSRYAFENWISFVKTGAIKKMFEKQAEDHSKGFANEITIKSFRRLFARKGLDYVAGLKVMRWLRKSQLFPGELGSAIYSQNQITLFDQITAAMTKGQGATLSSYTYPTKKKTGKGHSGGEATYQGIAGGHAYTVLDTKSDTDGNPESKPGTGKFKWIKIRNPWGFYGREYDFSKAPDKMAQAIEKGDGSFWLELSDLTRYFHGLDLTSKGKA